MGKLANLQVVPFAQRKRTFLGKDDKSSAGGIDAHAREICAAINERGDLFTTSSCSGRAFLWCGKGIKSTNQFVRYRVTHELVEGGEAETYFDLPSLADEVVDGAWEQERHRTRERSAPARASRAGGCLGLLASVARAVCAAGPPPRAAPGAGETCDRSVWLRFEPFILHVCCRDFEAADGFIAAARTVFKNVGVSSWSEGKVMVHMWGDEGLDMVVRDPEGRQLFPSQALWLQDLVNSRHRRNWAKIDRFTEAVRSMGPAGPARAGCAPRRGGAVDEDADADDAAAPSSQAGPRSFDVVGDVAILAAASAEVDRAALGAAVMAENRKIKVVAMRSGSLQTDHRKPGALEVIAGPNRRPLVTTHTEFGVRYVVDLEAVFFTARMGPERQRLCAEVKDGERVCVLFAGCCPEALQIADKTGAASIVAVELNPDAVRCARRSLDLLAKKDFPKAARLQVREGDALNLGQVLAAEAGSFNRLIAPRPKASSEAEDDALARDFLRATLPLLAPGGVCHWYDFVADWEFPACQRSVDRISEACGALGRRCRVLRCAAANNKPVAERQYRTVIDFAVD